LRRLVLSILCVTACHSTSAPPAAEAPPAAIPMLVEVGRDEYARSCATCHGADARGGETPVGNRAPDLTQIAARRGGDFPADEIGDWIDGRLIPSAHGTREMPVWGSRFARGLPPEPLTQDLVRGRIVTLVEYLRSIQVE
jgi:mono/diheme cytochrome c family protein